MRKEELVALLEKLIEDVRNNKLSVFEWSTVREPLYVNILGMCDFDSMQEITTIKLGRNSNSYVKENK